MCLVIVLRQRSMVLRSRCRFSSCRVVVVVVVGGGGKEKRSDS